MDIKSEIIAGSICESTNNRWLLLIVTNNNDPLNSVGELRYMTSNEGILNDAHIKNFFYPADLWQSPQGSQWILSGLGNVFTDANVNFPNSIREESRYGYTITAGEWATTTLNLDMQLGVMIWGLNDKNVYVVDIESNIFHWNGTNWSSLGQNLMQGYPMAIGGLSEDDIYLSLRNGPLLYFDGNEWQVVPLHDNSKDIGTINAITMAGDTVYAATQFGYILYRTPGNDLKIRAYLPDTPFYDATIFNNKLLLSAGNQGLFELKKNDELSHFKVEAHGLRFFQNKTYLGVTSLDEPVNYYLYGGIENKWKRIRTNFPT